MQNSRTDLLAESGSDDSIIVPRPIEDEDEASSSSSSTSFYETEEEEEGKKGEEHQNPVFDVSKEDEEDVKDSKEEEEDEGEDAKGSSFSFAAAYSDCMRSRWWRKKKYWNFFFLLLASMCFKFSFETMSSAVALTVLDRIHGIGGATGVAILTILYSLSQAVSSLITAHAIRRFRANHLVAFLFVVFAGLISIIIILEASTGGTLEKEGTWNVWGIFPIYLCIGLCFGMIEVARKCIPPLIFDGNSISMKRANACVHVAYEIAGTAGAFLSTVFIRYLGSVYAMIHMPFAFVLSAFFFLLVRHRFEPLLGEKQEDDPEAIAQRDDALMKRVAKKVGKKTARTCKVVGKGLVEMVKEYFLGLWMGFKLIVLSRKYCWLLFAYVLPQVLHRLIENLLVPVYAKHVLHQGDYSGILIGGSNFGELCGAALVAITARCIPGRYLWVRLDAICINLLWLFPFIETDALTFVLAMIPVMAVVSGSWAAGDVTLLSYLQSTLPHEDDKEDDEDDITSPLGAAIGFMYALYVALIAVLAFGLGQALDRFKDAGDLRTGVAVLVAIFSACGLLAFISTFFGKIEKELHERESPEEIEAKEEGKGDEEMKDASAVINDDDLENASASSSSSEEDEESDDT